MTIASAPETLPHWRAASYVAAVMTRTVLAVAVSALLAAPILAATTDRSLPAEHAAALATAGLALLGLGLPVVSAMLAHTDWAGASALQAGAMPNRPEVRLREPKTLVRPLAYSVAMLTVGGALAVSGLLTVIGSLVALYSPYLAATGDSAVIGPVTVTTVPQSLVAGTIGATVLALLTWASPLIARTHVPLLTFVWVA